MIRIEIRKAKLKEPVFFYVLVDGRRVDYAICLEQERSLRHLVDFIAMTQGDQECEIVCESDELKEKIAEIHNNFQSEKAALQASIEKIKTKIYKIDELSKKIEQTGLITVKVAEKEMHHIGKLK